MTISFESNIFQELCDNEMSEIDGGIAPSIIAKASIAYIIFLSGFTHTVNPRCTC